MPWKETTMERERIFFVQRTLNKEKSKSALCREYGISRPTGDKWIARYLNGETMSDRSRAPFRTPNKTSPDAEERIVALRQRHPAIGAKKLKRLLENQGQPAPAYSTINAILHRNGLITPEASQAATPYHRFEKARANEMWQADFKGHFAMANGLRCYPLTVLDDHSRFNLCIDAKGNEQYVGVRESFLRLFHEYGLPDTLLCDNGKPWAGSRDYGYAQFEVWLMELGILTKHGRAYHPQTQGKEERFHGSLKRELLKHHTIADSAHAQRLFDEYRGFYNHERPHHALNLDTPANRYTRSSRELPNRIRPWEYSGDYKIRKVKQTGEISFLGHPYIIGKAFFGRQVGLYGVPAMPDTYSVMYRQFCVAKINIADKTVVARRLGIASACALNV